MHAAEIALPRSNRQHVRAQLRDLRLYGPLGALAERDHGDHRADADDDAEHGEHRPELVGPDRVHRDLHDLEEEHQFLCTPGIRVRFRMRSSSSCCCTRESGIEYTSSPSSSPSITCV